MTTSGPASSSRAIFLDVDGTYADHGEVPAAHVDAVRGARAAGHLVFLCTGRPASLLPAHLTEAGFDGIVAGAGAYATMGDTVLLDTRFPAALAARALAALDTHGALYFLEAPEATYGRAAVRDAMRAHLPRRPGPDGGESRAGRDVLAAIEVREDLSGVSFGKITCFYGRTPLPEVAALIGPEVATVPSSIPELGPGAGEMYLSDVHKAVGIEAVIAHLGLPRERAIAFGDGFNDLEMLAYAGIGVAIEGSPAEVVAVADRTAPPPRLNGLATAFAELGLLG